MQKALVFIEKIGWIMYPFVHSRIAYVRNLAILWLPKNTSVVFVLGVLVQRVRNAIFWRA